MQALVRGGRLLTEGTGGLSEGEGGEGDGGEERSSNHTLSSSRDRRAQSNHRDAAAVR